MNQDVDRLFLFEDGFSGVGDCLEVAQVDGMRDKVFISEGDV